MPKMEEMGYFGTQRQHLSGLAHYFFLLFCLKLGFNKHKKVMEPIIRGKTYTQNEAIGSIFGHKVNIEAFWKSVQIF